MNAKDITQRDVMKMYADAVNTGCEFYITEFEVLGKKLTAIINSSEVSVDALFAAMLLSQKAFESQITLRKSMRQATNDHEKHLKELEDLENQ